MVLVNVIKKKKKIVSLVRPLAEKKRLRLQWKNTLRFVFLNGLCTKILLEKITILLYLSSIKEYFSVVIP